jgi:Tol biopolymer transport system component
MASIGRVLTMIGQRLGHYRIVEEIGKGGMGVVYRAHDEQLDRDVALKLLPAATLADESARARLLREARAAAALNHPHICTIHEVGEAGSQAYIAMEYLEGGPLSHVIPADGLPVEQLLRYGQQITAALTHAHERGIVHRDLKSGNVLITSDGRAKVLDFGLAKRLSGKELTEATTQSQASMTQAGALAGTVPYMAPEQLRGQPADARSDVWALGVVLYEMTAGARPFQGQTGFELSSAILNQAPPPLPAKVPLELRAVIERCLEKEPSRRYQRASEMHAALEAIQAGAGSPGVALRHTMARWRWAWVALPPVLLATGFFAWLAWRAPESTEPLRAVPLTTQPGVHRYPSFSPDGNHVAFTWTGPKQDNTDIYVQQIGAGSPLRLTNDPSNHYNPVWSPDGRWIAFLRLQSEGKSELRLIAPLGGPERKVTEIRVREVFVAAPYLAWCPDSNCLVVTDSPGEGKPVALFVVSLESGEKRQLTNPQPPAAGDAHPAVSPDASWLVFRRNANNLFTGELYRLPLGKGLAAAGEPRRLTPVELDAEYPTWMPGSQEILFSAKGCLWRLVVPGESQPARLPFAGEDGLMPVVSQPQPGGPSRLVYIRSFDDYNIWRVETSAAGATATSPPVVSISSTRADDMPQLSPDGRRVAFTSDRSGGWEIWLVDPDGSNAVQLTSMGARVAGYPHWSPDGEMVVFHSNLGGQSEVYVIPAAGGKPRNLTSHPALDAFPSFSRDGKWIYFTSNRTGENRIWKVPASGGDVVQVTNNVGHTPLESPDGAYVYYVRDVFTPSPLWRVTAAGGVPVKVLEGVVLGNFAVLKGGIYYIDRPSGEGGIYLIDRPSGETRLQYFDFATRRSRTVARNLGIVDLPLTASPDGRTILYPRLDSSVDDLMLVENFR